MALAVHVEVEQDSKEELKGGMRELLPLQRPSVAPLRSPILPMNLLGRAAVAWAVEAPMEAVTVGERAVEERVEVLVEARAGAGTEVGLVGAMVAVVMVEGMVAVETVVGLTVVESKEAVMAGEAMMAGEAE